MNFLLQMAKINEILALA